MSMAIKWLWCRFKEEDSWKVFIATCMGAKIKPGSGYGSKKGSVTDLTSVLSQASKGQSKGFSAERVKVSPEELARRESERQNED